MVKKFFAALLSILFYPLFFGCLIIFHVTQVICKNIFGKIAHKKSVDLLNFFLIRCLNVMGNRTQYINKHQIPENKPLLFVSNHQSMFDISMIVWYMRKYSPHFISKIELGKGIPSISYNLRHGGSVLIDRKNKRQSLPALIKFGQRLQANNETGVLFPEGTRSKNGLPKTFMDGGFKILTKAMPDGYIVPLTLNNSWKLLEWGNFPVGAFNKVILEVHKPIAIASCEAEELLNKVERQIKEAVK